MHKRSDSKTKTTLPKTLEEFLAQKKKQQVGVLPGSVGKRTTRKD